MALMSAIPSANPLESRERIILKGEIPSPIEPPDYCRLATRCPFATEECRSTRMVLQEVSPGHSVACIRTVRGEIPIPEYNLAASPVVVAKPSGIDESAAVADDLDLMKLRPT